MKKLVNKFLSWPLPETVCSDLCATMPNYPHRTGTTLLTADEAEQMLKYVVGSVLEERDQYKNMLVKEFGHPDGINLVQTIVDLQKELDALRAENHKIRNQYEALEEGLIKQTDKLKC